MAPVQSPDFDELAPDHFLVRDDRLRPVLRGEGTIDGAHFTLGTWRRDGLIARLRSSGFTVRTLDERIAGLPRLPAPALGDEHLQPRDHPRQQWAAFDGERLRWRDLPVVTDDGRTGVRVRIGEPLRRRRSRQGGDFFRLLDRGTGLRLEPLSEDDALLHAYSILAQSDRPAHLILHVADDLHHLDGSTCLLPGPHRQILDLLNTRGARWSFAAPAWALVQQLLARLAIVIEPNTPVSPGKRPAPR
ncbi:MAG: hypothetical protein NVSMB42_24020 [Herpetosiphon sp.]